MPNIIQQRYDTALARQIERIAAMAVVATVETEGLGLDTYQGHAWDMRPALDETNFADDEIELVRDHVNLGIDAGWLQSVPGGSRYVVLVTWTDSVPGLLSPHPDAARSAAEGGAL